MIQGLGGLVVKPVSGVVDLISKTTVGLKNTMILEDEEIFQQRYPRPFYGKFKNIRTYDWIDAKVIYFINKLIPSFQKKIFNEYVGSVGYQSEKGENHLLVFGVNEFYLIELSRFELIFKLGYEYIKTVSIGENSVITIDFNYKVNGKTRSNIKIKSEDKALLAQKILKLFREALNVDS